MNIIALKGRLTKEVEYSTSKNNIGFAKFSIAVNRDFKNEKGEYDADFINCVAFKSNADFINKYFKKGQEILINGSLRTEHYQDKNGDNKIAYKVLVEHSEFCGSKAETKDEYADFGQEINIDNNFLD